jgi:predicted MPP superfamily phosphohydrolase
MQGLAVALCVIPAIAGTCRIGLFALNRGVVGEKSGTEDRMKWLMIFIPPLLIVLSFLYIPLYRSISRGTFSFPGMLGAVWLGVTVTTGCTWVVRRAWHLTHRPEIPGVALVAREMVAMRRRHFDAPLLRWLGVHNDAYDLDIPTFEVTIPHLPHSFDGYRIAFLTDLHVAPFMRRKLYQEALRQIAHRQVDLVLLGGDFISFRRHIELMAEVLTSGLTPPDGTFAVLGNHDYWTDADAVVAALSTRGVVFITNRSVTIRRGEEALLIAGIDEVYRGHPDVEAALSNADPVTPVIVVSHHPDIVDVLGNRRIDLLVCGHTHGGQIRLPFFGAIVVPSKHEGRYAAGFFREKNFLMYVSRGIGAVPPLRILCPPELPIFVLRKGNASAQ